jgi:hypothetical protein
VEDTNDGFEKEKKNRSLPEVYFYHHSNPLSKMTSPPP